LGDHACRTKGVQVRYHRNPSTYLALVIWGATAFESQPTMASFIVHFTIVPALMAGTLWLAHWEGRH
jgi:hypothetical protein